MRNNPIISFAEDLLENGINPAPVSIKKYPWYSWTKYQDELITIEDILKHSTDSKFWGLCLFCGKISGGLETIDFDSHYEDIEPTFNKFMEDDGVIEIIRTNNLYLEKTIGKGFHLIYRYDCDLYEGNQVLSANEVDKTLIETRGEGGLIVCAPSPGYTVISGDIIKMSVLSIEERNYLLDTARLFNRSKKIKEDTTEKQKAFHYTDPVTWYNWNKSTHAKSLLKDEGWHWVSTKDGIEHWERPGKNEGSTSATWGRKENQLYVFSTDASPFQQECYYTPFQILVILMFKFNYNSALNWIISKYFSEQIPYVRVGIDYFKKIHKIDRFSIDGFELKKWTKEEIKQDHGKTFIDKVPKFDDFCIVPDNFNYSPVVNNCYNLYCEFRHLDKTGSWKWTKILLDHVFGEQIELGIRYLQLLYLHPDRMAPILVLVSKERSTGKTTFLNWLNMIFGGNMVVISPEDLVNGFNHLYATANIIAVEETLIEKSITVEKIKALATGKFISVNQKFVSQYKLPFFGKIIMTSNNEDKFARIDDEEIRFFIRKLGSPKHNNHNIEHDLVSEIPHFLNYLSSRLPIDFTVGRVPFTPDELQNDNLSAVKKESKSGLYKDLVEHFTDLFNNMVQFKSSVHASPIDIKNRWFAHNQKIDPQYIKNVLKNEFQLTPHSKIVRYDAFGEPSLVSKTGTPYTFTPEMFGISELDNIPDYLDETKKDEQVPF